MVGNICGSLISKTTYGGVGNMVRVWDLDEEIDNQKSSVLSFFSGGSAVPMFTVARP